MSWRETRVMDERLAFMFERQSGERSMSELCAVFGVSRKTGYKWLNRYRELGVNGLADGSRAALHHPNAVDAELVEHIVALRRRHPLWGPLKLRQWLQRRDPEQRWPVPSTIAQMLSRADLVKPRRRRRQVLAYGRPTLQAATPNALWSADFKGRFRTGDGCYCHPLTISDNFSRYLLACRGLTRYSGREVRPWFERAFREYGLPQAIRTDNGAPFGSNALAGITALSVWWLKLGIIPEHIAPGKPQQNPRHERMHGTLKRAACRPRTNVADQQRVFDRFVVEYNQERPHQSLHGRTPAMVYERSPRSYPSTLPRFAYPEGFYTRRVLPSGDVRWLGERMRASEALIGEDVGLRLIDEGIWLLYVGPLAIGKIDARCHRIERIQPFIDLQRA
jgi:putative transposase